MPPVDPVGLKLWKKADVVVKSWFLNSIVKPMSGTFMYFPTSQALWAELERRFGESCGPQFYQLQREVSTLDQETNSVTIYYGKLYKCWDELQRLLSCVCVLLYFDYLYD